MRRFLTLVCLLCLAIPAGVSISGCTRNPGGNYCNGLGYGPKISDLAALDLTQNATTGISIAYGQTHSVSAPQALNCKNAAVNAGTISWGTTNQQLVDISPAGNICAGTWNRNTGGGIADFTICSPPNPLPSTNGLPYATAYITASAQTVVSNPVEVYVHAQVTSVDLVGPQTCLSQNQTATLDAQACYAGASNQYQLCAPAGTTACPYAAGDARCNNPSQYFVCPGGLNGATSIPSCTAAIGTLSYSVGTSNIATLSTNTTNNQVTITALMPGTTPITASVAQSGSAAGYFSTCPPQSIAIALANGEQSGTITQGVSQNLVTTIYDNNVASCPPTSANPAGGCQINGLNLDYQSTDPIDISTGSGGAITTSFPGVASVYAICQPGTCNPAPINEVGIFGTGLPISSNRVTITVPGAASDYLWFGAPGQSQYIVPVELLTGTVGSTIRLPYVPNSMQMDRLGVYLYLGSERELMIYNVGSGLPFKQDTTVPGVVLAVAPNSSEALINDQVLHRFYIYSPSGGLVATFGGMGGAASWTPDSKTLYITDSAALNNTPENIAAGITGHTDTLYTYDGNIGWTIHALPCSVYDAKTCPNPTTIGAQNLAITVPSVGAFLTGTATTAHTWCPTGTVGDYNSMNFYPQSDSVDAATDVLAATTDGQHILGAVANDNGVTLSDIGVDVAPAECSLSAPLSTGPTLDATLPVTVNSPPGETTDNQIIPSPQSKLAFLTYSNSGTTTGASLPYYVPGSGQIGYVPLTGSSVITAPVAGAFTPDDTLFFVSTSGDNLVHYISIPTVINSATPLTDTQQINPNLPACTPGTDFGCTLSAPTSNSVPATVIVVKPRSTT